MLSQMNTSFFQKRKVEHLIETTSYTEEFKKIQIYISKKKWLRAKELVGQLDRKCIEQFGTSNTRQNILHFCCRHQAPISLMKQLVEISPELIEGLDCNLRTPLHIAIRDGMSVQSVSYLIEQSTKISLNKKDIDGYTALHTACLNDGKLRSLKFSTRYEMVKVLLKASPKSVIMEDVEGMNPIEHAICGKLHEELIKLLQMYACKVRQKILSLQMKKRISSTEDAKRSIVSNSPNKQLIVQ